MKLISMIDFVLQQTEQMRECSFQELSDKFIEVDKYANFLKQPLKLGMFIPCENGVLLEVPEICSCSNQLEAENCAVGCNFDKIEQYQKAQEKVLFKGFGKIRKANGYTNVITHEKREIYSSPDEMRFVSCINGNRLDTIEDLVNYNLELTDYAIKIIKP